MERNRFHNARLSCQASGSTKRIGGGEGGDKVDWSPRGELRGVYPCEGKWACFLAKGCCDAPNVSICRVKISMCLSPVSISKFYISAVELRAAANSRPGVRLLSLVCC